jgi:hypothetical protein
MTTTLYAPVILFCYNRLDHTRKTVQALQKNELAKDTDLIIYSDAPKHEQANSTVEALRLFLKTISGFKSVQIIEREKNLGLAASIIDGVSKVTSDYGRAIVLEDDLVTHPGFLKFMNEGLVRYENDEHVISIHGFAFPIAGLPETFFLKGADCWGWATWSRGWKLFEADGSFLLEKIKKTGRSHEFDFDGQYPYVKMLEDQIAGKNASWAVRWYASAFLSNKLTLYPGRSLVRNIGYDSGTHMNDGKGGDYFGVLSPTEVKIGNPKIEHSHLAYGLFSRFFQSRKISLPTRIKNKILKIMRLT